MGGKVINGIGFYAGWVACVWGGAQGHLYWGPALVLLIVCFQMIFWNRRAAKFRVLGIAMLVGFLVDTFFAWTGFQTFITSPPGVWWSPPWMVALWANFSATLWSSLGWLRRNRLAAFGLGALGGPLSYWAGERLGAVELAGGASLFLLGLAWGVLVPALASLPDWLGADSQQQVTAP